MAAAVPASGGGCPPQPQPASEPSLPTLRVGLLGCGWFMQRAHIPTLLKLEQPKTAAARGFAVRVVSICSSGEASLQCAARKLQREGGAPLPQYTDMALLFADPAVDAVLIALPIPLMAAAIGAALRAGTHSCGRRNHFHVRPFFV